ncbi:ankyrin repeat protein, partial [Cooperia oncophora]
MCAACEHGQADTVQFFLSRGASLSTMQWPPGRPALICAVESGSWDLVVAVFALPNCDIECKDAFGRTPIIVAARCAHVGLIDMLLNKGADINQRDDYGWTALTHAVHKNHLPSVQLLLDRNAEITGKDKSGQGARLRSTTWQTAIEFYPEALFVLFSKLMDDAGILFRKKRFEDAMHRLHYALNKCEMCKKGYEQYCKVGHMQSGILKVRQQIIMSIARVLRRQGRTQQAIDICASLEANACEQILFECHLLRAKCHFDLQDM